MKTLKKTESAKMIRIVYQGECTKLTPRGKGTLSYELGIDDEQFVRIAGNSQGGTFSVEWISLQSLENLLENPDPKAITAVAFKKVFIGRSANNHGYLAAILIAENIIASNPKEANQLNYLSFDGIKAKIDSLKDIDLPDHIAASLKLREEKKAAIKKTAPTKPAQDKKKASK